MDVARQPGGGSEHTLPRGKHNFITSCWMPPQHRVFGKLNHVCKSLVALPGESMLVESIGLLGLGWEPLFPSPVARGSESNGQSLQTQPLRGFCLVACFRTEFILVVTV